MEAFDEGIKLRSMAASPKDSWNDVENGYRSKSGSTEILIEPEQSTGGSVWTVTVMQSTHRWVATRFEDQRTAREFAKLLTYLFTDLGYQPAKSTMQDTSLNSEGESLPSVVGEDRDAESVLREAMGIEEHHLDRALE